MHTSQVQEVFMISLGRAYKHNEHAGERQGIACKFVCYTARHRSLVYSLQLTKYTATDKVQVWHAL